MTHGTSILPGDGGDPSPDAAASTQSPRTCQGALSSHLLRTDTVGWGTGARSPQHRDSRCQRSAQGPGRHGLSRRRALSWPGSVGGEGRHPHRGQGGAEGLRGRLGWGTRAGSSVKWETAGRVGGGSPRSPTLSHLHTHLLYPFLYSGHDDSPGKSRPKWVAIEHLVAQSALSDLLTWRSPTHPAHLFSRPPSLTPP